MTIRDCEFAIFTSVREPTRVPPAASQRQGLQLHFDEAIQRKETVVPGHRESAARLIVRESPSVRVRITFDEIFTTRDFMRFR